MNQESKGFDPKEFRRNENLEEFLKEELSSKYTDYDRRTEEADSEEKKEQIESHRIDYRSFLKHRINELKEIDEEDCGRQVVFAENAKLIECLKKNPGDAGKCYGKGVFLDEVGVPETIRNLERDNRILQAIIDDRF